MSKSCPNCFQLNDQDAAFCSNCGQDQKARLLPIGALMTDLLQDVFAFDTKFFRSIPKLLFQPGGLTNEFIRGRRARYVPVVRLYILVSLIAFSLFSLNIGFRPDGAQPLRIDADSSGAYMNGEKVDVTGLRELNHELDSVGLQQWKETNYSGSTGIHRLAI